MVERGELLRFDNFLLDKHARALHRVLPDGGTIPIQVGSRALQILCLLVEGAGQIIASRQIMDAVWPDIAVEQNNLTVQISALRRVLDLDREQGSCIQNIPGRGYCLVPMVTRASPTTVGSVGPAPPAEDPAPSGARLPTPLDNPDPKTVPLPPTRPRRSRVVRLGLSGLCVAALMAVGIWYLDGAISSQVPPVGPRTMGTLADRPRLSLVVLPFLNSDRGAISDDAVDAITEDLISDLGRVYGFLVIGRGSAFSYKGRPLNIKHIGEELGVRYAVEGSVRKVDGTLRVNVQLVSTETGTQMWADRFDIERDGFSYNLDEIVRPISHVLNARVADIESSRSARERPTNPDVTDLVLRAHSLNNQPPSRDQQNERVQLMERAVQLDPSSATALAGLAEALMDSIPAFAEDPAVPEKLRRADDLTRRAEQLRPNDMPTIFVRVYLLGMQRRCPEVFPAAERAIWMYPNITSTPMWLGICLLFDGKAAEAIPQFEQSIRLNPRNSYVFNRYLLLGYASLFLDRHDEAIIFFRKSLALPNNIGRDRASTFAALSAAQALSGRVAEAHSSAAEAARLWPTLTVQSYYQFNFPANPINAARVSRMREGLRLAGIRDHADAEADFGLDSDGVLHFEYEAPTPTTAPGVRTIQTADLATLVERERPLVLDTTSWGKSVPGSIGLWRAGIGGGIFDQYQERLRNKMNQLTANDLTVPVVAMGWNAERFQGRNLALRLVALGYTNVYWYRGGREAWEVAGLPETELPLQDW
jgi:adenylate cyclase